MPDLAVRLLGLVGEVGSIATEYKKMLRDGPAHVALKSRVREELGDVLWYAATVASKFGLDLEDVAVANLQKTADRWLHLSDGADFFDSAFPPHEQLPRHATFEIVAVEHKGRPASQIFWNGVQVGDTLTDASFVADGYRFHDVFHLAHAAVLGWSPVSRSLLGRKRRSDPQIDEAEDGGRAIVIEEGIAALVFAYAASHNYLRDVRRVDNSLLETVRMLVAPLEVSVRSGADWERAILTGYRAWNQLQAAQAASSS